jgi:hypothetical protein
MTYETQGERRRQNAAPVTANISWLGQKLHERAGKKEVASRYKELFQALGEASLPGSVPAEIRSGKMLGVMRPTVDQDHIIGRELPGRFAVGSSFLLVRSIGRGWILQKEPAIPKPHLACPPVDEIFILQTGEAFKKFIHEPDFSGVSVQEDSGFKLTKAKYATAAVGRFSTQEIMTGLADLLP